MAESKRTIIWPAYIDSKKTQGEGRKIPKKYAVSSPKLREISNASKKLGLNPQVENEKHYPKSWWESTGRIIIDKKMPKREILLKISNMINASRA
jgi:signal recognition particle subunit SRP19